MDLSQFLPKKLAKKLQSEADAKLCEQDKVDDPLRAFLPTTFGKNKNDKKEIDFKSSKREDGEVKEIPKTLEAEDLPPTEDKVSNQYSSNSDDPSESEDDATEVLNNIPLTHEAKLSSHTKSISSLALDRSGARLVSGSYDQTVKMWDFSGMDSFMRPFRSFEPEERHCIRDLQYSISGDQILIISGALQPKIYSRDGILISTYMKGDPYIRDLRHTKGHVASLSCGSWHPFDRNTFLTASQDNSIRIWDVESLMKHKEVIVVQSKQRGGRSPVTSAAFSYDGKWIAGASQDGSLNLWPTNGPFLRPANTILEAHQFGSDTSSLTFSRNNFNLISRGGDDTVKLWDIRNFTSPILQSKDLTNFNSETNVVFSPDEKLIVTGVGVKKGEGYGKLAFLDRSTLEVVRSINVSQSSVVKVLWHPALNQIAAGSGDGSIHMFFDPIKSLRGAKLCAARQPRKRHIEDFEVQGSVFSPLDHPKKMSKRQIEKRRMDPVASRRPDPPLNGPGRGGKVGTNYTNHIMKTMIKDKTRDEDPREALLKYAKEAEESPQFISQAYKKSQPKPVFDEREDENDDREVVRRP